MPVATPVTTPPLLTVAFDGTVLLHVPPGVPSTNVVVAPGHTDVVPEIDPPDVG